MRALRHAPSQSGASHSARHRTPGKRAPGVYTSAANGDSAGGRLLEARVLRLCCELHCHWRASSSPGESSFRALPLKSSTKVADREAKARGRGPTYRRAGLDVRGHRRGVRSVGANHESTNPGRQPRLASRSPVSAVGQSALPLGSSTWAALAPVLSQEARTA